MKHLSPPRVTHDTRWYLRQNARALSRLLNAIFGGEGDTTFSAGSWSLYLAGSRWGKPRVWFVDVIVNREEGHCRKAWEWHRDRGLLEMDSADD